MVAAVKSLFPAGCDLHRAGGRDVPVDDAPAGIVGHDILRERARAESHLRAGESVFRRRRRREHAAAESIEVYSMY